ncbi:hypothetical protein FOZ63_001840, partial [Perkinsus olseni]
PMEPDEVQRLSELKAKGISVEPRFLGCRIVQSDPLPRMTFTISVHGDVIDTQFEDIERNAKCYVFESFNAIVWSDVDGTYRAEPVKKANWKELKNSYLLPFGDLPRAALRVFQQNTPKQDKNTPKRLRQLNTESQCLRILETIMAHPPLGYDADRGSTQWIYNFYRDNGRRIKRKVRILQNPRLAGQLFDEDEEYKTDSCSEYHQPASSSASSSVVGESTRISALKARGISIHPRFLGCRIAQSDPLPKMNFTISIYGDVFDTEFEDIERDARCFFWKSFDTVVWGDKDSTHRAGDMEETDWAELEQLGLLPLAHLSREDHETIQNSTFKQDKNTPKRLKKLNTESQCLRIVETLMANPPPRYEGDRGSTNWLFKFYTDNGVPIKEKVQTLEEVWLSGGAEEEEEMADEEGSDGGWSDGGSDVSSDWSGWYTDMDDDD